MTQDMKKVFCTLAFPILVFTSKTDFFFFFSSNLRLQTPVGKVWSKEVLLPAEEGQVKEYLSRMDLHKSTDPDGIHP